MHVLCYKNISPQVAQLVSGVGKVSGGVGSFGRRGGSREGKSKRAKMTARSVKNSKESDRARIRFEAH